MIWIVFLLLTVALGRNYQIGCIYSQFLEPQNHNTSIMKAVPVIFSFFAKTVILLLHQTRNQSLVVLALPQRIVCNILICS